MPQAGNTMEEGTVIKWRVNRGDRITVGQIFSRSRPTKRRWNSKPPTPADWQESSRPWEQVAVKEPVAFLAENDAEWTHILASSWCAGRRRLDRSRITVAWCGASSEPATANNGIGRVKASPAARRMAAESGVELASVGAGRPGRTNSLDRSELVAAVAPSTTCRRPQAAHRRCVGQSASTCKQSKQTVPHFYVRTTIDADPLLAFYKTKSRHELHAQRRDVLAVGRTIREFPAVRSRSSATRSSNTPRQHRHRRGRRGRTRRAGGHRRRHDSRSRNSGRRRRSASSKPPARASSKTSARAISRSATSACSASKNSPAIINPPEVGHPGRQRCPRGGDRRETARCGRPRMMMTLSADHRIVDGVMAAKFMQRLKERPREPRRVVEGRDDVGPLSTCW